MMLTTEPAHVEWLAVIVMMCVSFGFAADFAWPAGQFPLLDGSMDFGLDGELEFVAPVCA
jgi:hypothetical protein